MQKGIKLEFHANQKHLLSIGKNTKFLIVISNGKDKLRLKINDRKNTLGFLGNIFENELIHRKDRKLKSTDIKM